MKIFYDCLPCLLNQALSASRMTGCDEEQQGKIMDAGIALIQNYRDYKTAPDIARAVHGCVKEITGVGDVYRDIKDRDIALAKKLLPTVKGLLDGVNAEQRLKYAAKIAAIGNVLDSAIIKNAQLEESIEAEFKKEFSVYSGDIFADTLKTAKTILYISDNCGETVFDTVFLQEIRAVNPDVDITYATREAPILNDATVEDAIESGVAPFARIISSGSRVPGTALDEVNDAFKQLFASADIIISKGQGNYESMSECGTPIFYLLKAKCDMIARNIDVPVGGYVFKLQ